MRFLTWLTVSVRVGDTDHWKQRYIEGLRSGIFGATLEVQTAGDPDFTSPSIVGTAAIHWIPKVNHPRPLAAVAAIVPAGAWFRAQLSATGDVKSYLHWVSIKPASAP